MSVRKMIASHPLVHGHINEPLAEAAKHAMYCALICTSCADACSGEEMDMRQCIRTCLDCADVCTATSHMAVRQTGHDDAALRGGPVAATIENIPTKAVAIDEGTCRA